MTVIDLAALDRTVFDTPQWRRAWSRNRIEQQDVLDGPGGGADAPPLYLTRYSPFWQGYERDVGMAPVWDRPVVTVGSVYEFFGPGYLAADPAVVAALTDHGLAGAAEHDAAGLLVLNLPPAAAQRWSQVREPALSVRLDAAYHQLAGVGPDPVLGPVSKRVRTDWRRRWRRATEQGVRLVEDRDPSGARMDEVIGLANTSAVRHGWEPIYDLATVAEVLRVPGARLIRADWQGRTVAGFVALEHDRCLYLWAGGTDPVLLREVSPYLFLLYEILAAAPERGWDRIEFGRGNDEFKRKYGFTGVELWSLWYPGRAGDQDGYRNRLRTLHDGLTACMGL